MASAEAIAPVQIVNHGLALERQKLLRDTLTAYFGQLSKRGKVSRQIQYIFNRESLALERVLKLNEGADALFTAFPYEDQGASFPAPMIGPDGRELSPAPAHLRYPLIAEATRLIDKGAFRHRKAILVGDIYAKIGNALKSKIRVQLTHFIDEARTQVSPPVVIRSLAQLSPLEEKEEAQARKELTGKAGSASVIPVSRIDTVQIADVPFDGIVNMPEQHNRFVLKDQTVLDTTRKLFLMRSARIGIGQEKTDAENRIFVQAKRMLVVLQPDLEHVISDRLMFDGMERLWRAHTPEQALGILSNAKSQGIVGHFESEGYDALLEATTPEERDRLLLQLLGDRLPGLVERELSAAKSAIGALQGSDLNSVLNGVPMPVMDQVLTAIQNKSMDRFLSFVPVKIRDRVVLEFLNSAEHVRAVWLGSSEAERKEMLQVMVPQILAQLYLTDTQLYTQRFPNLKLEFANTVNSQTIARLRPDEQAQTFTLVAKAIEQKKAALPALQQNLPPPQVERLLLDVILKRPADSYSRLTPLLRKQIWLTIGREYRQFIAASLNILDKQEIVKGLREGALDALFEHPAYLEFVRNPKQAAYTANLFLTLKKYAAGESKSALLKRLLTESEFRVERGFAVPRFLSAPENKALIQRLSEQVDVLDFRFDGLVCTKADLEPIKTQPALAGAVVILVDNLLDSALLKIFEQGTVSREDYLKLAANVEQELQATHKRLLEKAGTDPAGVYLIETMLTFNELAVQALSGRLTPAAMEKFGAREALRSKLLGGIKQQIEENAAFQGKAAARAAELAGRIKGTEQRIEQYTKEADAALAGARALMAECDQIVRAQAKAEGEKTLVARTQRDLSIEFFKIIQPLILDHVKSLSGPLNGLLKLVGIGKGKRGAASERVIFKFSDGEIEQILRHKIVFCTRDEILLQFILTCLRIDKLEDSLFTMASPETLPAEGIDILFYGPGYRPEDFAARVTGKHMVQFADEGFMTRLMANESLKARTKQALADWERQLAAKNAQMTEASGQANAIREKVRQVAQILAGQQEELARLQKPIDQARERAKSLADQVDVLETQFKQLDGRFQSVRTRLAELAAAGKRGEDAARLTDELTAELMKLNEDLARLMRVKRVKDVGSFISKSAQQRILMQIEVRERYPAHRIQVSRVFLVDDGSNVAQSLKRSFAVALEAYFRLKASGLETISISRLTSRLDAADPDDHLAKANLLLILAQEPGDNYQALRRLVARVRRQLPATHPILLAPYGELASLDAKSATRKNLLGIKERCTLVNLSNGDYADPQAVVRLLRDKAPLQPPAGAPAAQRSSA